MNVIDLDIVNELDAYGRQEILTSILGPELSDKLKQEIKKRIHPNDSCNLRSDLLESIVHRHVRQRYPLVVPQSLAIKDIPRLSRCHEDFLVTYTWIILEASVISKYLKEEG